NPPPRGLPARGPQLEFFARVAGSKEQTAALTEEPGQGIVQLMSPGQWQRPLACPRRRCFLRSQGWRAATAAGTVAAGRQPTSDDSTQAACADGAIELAPATAPRLARSQSP